MVPRNTCHIIIYNSFEGARIKLVMNIWNRRFFVFFTAEQYRFWYNSDPPRLQTLHVVVPLLRLRSSPDQSTACWLWSLRGAAAFGFVREGSHCCVRITKRNCSAARVLTMPEFLFEIYTLLCPRKNATDIRPRDPSRLSASAQRCRRKSELKQYQQPEKLPIFEFVHG